MLFAIVFDESNFSDEEMIVQIAVIQQQIGKLKENFPNEHCVMEIVILEIPAKQTFL